MWDLVPTLEVKVCVFFICPQRLSKQKSRKRMDRQLTFALKGCSYTPVLPSVLESCPGKLLFQLQLST